MWISIPEQKPPAGVVWRMSSGLYSMTTGAIGYGVGGVKYKYWNKCNLQIMWISIPEQKPPAGVIWRMSSGLHSVTTGAIGYGVGGVKYKYWNKCN